jgi:hydrogenase maturation protein HypF
VCWALDRDCPLVVPDPIVRNAWVRRVNAPQSTAAGRLFDAASALILGLGETSFEGQGPMWLEAIARDPVYFPQLQVRPAAGGQLELDWAPLIDWLLLSPPATDPADRAGAVHSALADGIVQVAERLRSESGASVVGLTGGVFQNRRLAETALARLSARRFEVLLHAQLPCNDGGLSYGQVADFIGGNE